MKNQFKRVSAFIFALILSTGLFFTSQNIVFAEDLPEEPAAAEGFLDTPSGEAAAELPEEADHETFSEEMLSEAIELYSTPMLGNSIEYLPTKDPRASALCS